jgi:hypothetical protein
MPAMGVQRLAPKCASQRTCCANAGLQLLKILVPRSEGNKTPKKDPGPVVFVLRTLPHQRFTRRGADLVYKVRDRQLRNGLRQNSERGSLDSQPV